jgi:hypothetical protein
MNGFVIDTPRLSATQRLQRVIALLLVACVLFSGATSAALAERAEQLEAEGTAYDREGGGPSSQRTLGNTSSGDLDSLCRTPHVPVRRCHPAWWLGTAADRGCARAAAWLNAESRDPDKTIRFCTYLI